MATSLPARGVWVEIACHRSCRTHVCHSPHGECGLKYERLHLKGVHRRHSPHGECGLKFHDACQLHQYDVTPRTGSVG